LISRLHSDSADSHHFVWFSEDIIEHAEIAKPELPGSERIAAKSLLVPGLLGWARDEMAQDASVTVDLCRAVNTRNCSSTSVEYRMRYAMRY
jgi:hypothetical protein